ncbi:MAG: FGGY family carbohydrate kinase, partial [Rhodobacteraceae bacterium]|nr:FGGY family carbohydrate kinase [Paracoccaceae bacterium]
PILPKRRIRQKSLRPDQYEGALNMYLGLDIGTSKTKAALFDTDGQEHVSVSCQTQVLSPMPGWQEFDGRQIWDSVISVIGQLLQKASIESECISGVGITAVMLGAWPIGRNGNLIRNPILWNDARTQPLIDRLVADDPEFYERIFVKSGSILQTGCILPVLAWLQKHEPEALARTNTVLCTKDYIRYRLTNRISTDASEATVAPGSVAGRNFDADLVSIFGIDGCAEMLPMVQESTAINGLVTTAAAAETGLLPGTPVAVGAGDVIACTIGAGVHRKGHAVSILGTACLNGVVRSEPDLSPCNLGLTFTMPEDRWLRCMVNNAGTINLDWVLNALCPDLSSTATPFDACAELAMQSPPGGQECPVHSLPLRGRHHCTQN